MAMQVLLRKIYVILDQRKFITPLVANKLYMNKLCYVAMKNLWQHNYPFSHSQDCSKNDYDPFYFGGLLRIFHNQNSMKPWSYSLLLEMGDKDQVVSSLNLEYRQRLENSLLTVFVEGHSKFGTKASALGNGKRLFSQILRFACTKLKIFQIKAFQRSLMNIAASL